MALDDDLLKELNGEEFGNDLEDLLAQMGSTNDDAGQMDLSEDLSGMEDILGDYDDIFGMMNSMEDEPNKESSDNEVENKKAGVLGKRKASRAQKKQEKAEKKKAKKAEKLEKKKAKKERKKNAKKEKDGVVVDELALSLESELNAMDPELMAVGAKAEETDLDMDLFSSAEKPDMSAFADKSELDDIEERSAGKKGKKEKKKKEKKEKKKKELSAQDKQELELKKAAKEQRRAEDRADVVKVKILDIVLGITIAVAVVCVTYFGSLAFSYQHRIKQATHCYLDKNYIEAYTWIGGLEVKEKDQGLYDQLACVMHVERSTKEFQSFYKTKAYKDALNSLLVAVKNYEHYLSEAKELGAEEPFQTSYTRVLQLLAEYYGINEADAQMIARTNSRTEYVKLVQERAKNVKVVTNVE